MRISRALWGVVLAVTAGTAVAGAAAETGSPASGFGTPRATMRTFLEAMADGEVQSAAACLDLSGIPAGVRKIKGRELAVQLKEVIDRIRFVRYEEIPDTREGDSYVFYRHERAGAIVIDRTESGRWLFTEATVRAVPRLYRLLHTKSAVEGVTETPTGASAAAWIRSKLPPGWLRRTLLLERWQWAGILMLVVAGFFASRLTALILRPTVVRMMRRFHETPDIERVGRDLRPVGVPVLALLWWVGLLALGLPAGALEILRRGLVLVVTASVVWILYRLTDLVAGVVEHRASRTEGKLDDLVVPLARKSAKVVVVAFGVVFVADQLGAQVGSLLAGLGLGGLAVALAAKDTLSNVFGSLTVVMDRPFHVGDWVIIGDLEGTVEEVGIRSTRIRTFHNSLITVPNSHVAMTSVDNMGARQYRRWTTTISVTYGTPPERLEAFCEGIRELVRTHPETWKDFFIVSFHSFGDSSLDIFMYLFFEAPDWKSEMAARHRLGVDIIRLAQHLGVSFAFPTQTVHLHRGDAAAPEPFDPASYGRRSVELMESARQEADRLSAGGRELSGDEPAPKTGS